MNILLLNWRDPLNPRSGGAEKVTFKYAQYWASQGHQITWICNSFPDSKDNEIVSGVRIVRVGPALGFTVLQLLLTYPIFLLRAIWTAISTLRRQKYDLVIDEIHGLPFFAPLYSHARTILWVCEVAGPIWDKMFPFPISTIGKLLEKIIYLMYSDTEIWAISKNTFQDVYDLNKNPRIKILPLGIDDARIPPSRKFIYPSAVFLGRLVKMKGVESAIKAASDISKKIPDFKLYVIGEASTEYLEFLRELVKKNKLSNNVIFCGRLNDADKLRLLSKVRFLIHTSYKEGFGLTVLEAGQMGTPAIVRSGSSLDELIENERSGLIFKSDDEISKLFTYWVSREKYHDLRRHAKENALRYTWNRILTSSNKLINND